MQSSPETYPIADFLKWNRENELILNPDFQRGQVWKDSAKHYLIDTILRGMPIPKILFRTTIDRQTHQIVREVVDGQQRLRAIIAFASGNLRLGSRAKEFAGLYYNDLEPELQDHFLAYKLTTEQLLNASNEDVLEIFARINSYTVPVNPPELRHAKYDSDFKWSVIETVKRASRLWETGVLSERDRVRMLDSSFIAEIYGLTLKGVTDGGQPKINTLYEEHKTKFAERERVEKSARRAIETVVSLVEEIHKQPITGQPHMLMLTAAVLYAQGSLPGADTADLPDPDDLLQDLTVVRENLKVLNAVLDSDEADPAWQQFWSASKSSTQRIASRKTRFPYYVRALMSTPL